MTATIEDWQMELDRWAMKTPHRQPLKPDPDLWELFAEDRAEDQESKLTVCPGCGRTTRNRRGKPIPGTVQRALADGSCWACHRRKGTQKLLAPYTPCRGCDRPLRPRRRSVEEFPGTVQHASHEMCTSCKRAQDRRNSRTQPNHTGKPCIGCGRTMRSGRQPIDRFPGTVAHKSGGRCRTCARNHKKENNTNG